MFKFRHSLFANALSLSMLLILSCQQSGYAEETLFESAFDLQEIYLHIDFSGATSVSETLASFDLQEKLKIVQVDVGDIELKPINEQNIMQNGNVLTVVLAYRDIVAARRIVVSIGDKKCTSIEFSRNGSNSWTESEIKAIAAAECTTYSGRSVPIYPTKDKYESACFSIDSSGGREAEFKSGVIAELLKELGEDQAKIDGYCPRMAGCLGFTTLRCMKDKFYSGDGTDDFDLDISTAGCPRGQQKYVLKRKPEAVGRLLSYFVICSCNNKN